MNRKLSKFLQTPPYGSILTFEALEFCVSQYRTLYSLFCYRKNKTIQTFIIALLNPQIIRDDTTTSTFIRYNCSGYNCSKNEAHLHQLNICDVAFVSGKIRKNKMISVFDIFFFDHADAIAALDLLKNMQKRAIS